MQINVQFESLGEMMGFAAQMAAWKAPVITSEGAVGQPESEKETIEEEPVTAVPEDEPAPAGEPKTSYTLVDVRTKLGALTKAGKKAQVQELIKSFGVEKLSQIPEEKYPEVMKKAGEL